SGRPRKASVPPPPLSVGDSPNAASVRAEVGSPPRVARLIDEPSHPTMDLTMARMPNPAGLANALPFSPGSPADAAAPYTQAQPPPRVRMRPLDDATATEEPAGLPSAMPAWLAAQHPPASTAHPRVEAPPVAAVSPPAIVAPAAVVAEIDGR